MEYDLLDSRYEGMLYKTFHLSEKKGLQAQLYDLFIT